MTLGPLLGRRFHVRGELGRGSSDPVLRAWDVVLGEDVALKRVRDARLDVLHRVAGVRHEGLARVHEVIAEGADAWLVLEPVAGAPIVEALRTDVVARGTPAPMLLLGQPLRDDGASVFSPCPAAQFPKLRRAIHHAAHGLAALHAAGLAHRDVHRDNVLLTADGARLVDFGMVAPLGVRPDGPLGIADGIAPELALEGATARGDFYALGVVLFEALTGAAPFAGSAEDVLRRKQTVPAPRASFVTRDVPPDLDDLAAAWLERVPSRRPGVEACARLAAW